MKPLFRVIDRFAGISCAQYACTEAPADNTTRDKIQNERSEQPTRLLLTRCRPKL
jgi:hypothetical protein